MDLQQAEWMQRMLDMEIWLAFATSGLNVLIILLAALILQGVTRRGLRSLGGLLERRETDAQRINRLRTLVRALGYVVSVVIFAIALMLVFNQFGISLAPILTAAGVLGLAIGFGAQSLVRDYFTGICLLIEDQLREGDVVEVGGKAGLVEAITLRYIRLRDYSGNVHFVPNGSVATVTNMSRDFAFAVMDVGVSYGTEVGHALEVMQEVGRELRADPTHGPLILEDLEVAGVDALADSAVVLRVRFKVAPLQQWGIRREYLRRVKAAFDREHIEIPFPHLTLYAGREGAPEGLPLQLSQTSREQAPA